MSRVIASRPATLSVANQMRTAILLIVLQATPVAFLLTGTNSTDWLLFAVIYPIQSIGVGVSLHRYFAHRSFKTSRWFQFMMALMAASVFGDAVRFTGKHRLHHRYSDTTNDTHTPLKGFWSCWYGSLLDNGYTDAELCDAARDLKKYPELMWLHRYWMVPGLVLCGIAFLIGGLSSVAIGVLLGSTLLLNQAAAVNYFCHKYGRRRFDTRDRSTNNALIAALSFGEGWHNNHHYYPATARAGFHWWEVDMYYWVIWLFEKLGLVWDVRQPTQEMLNKNLIPKAG